jgi:hypothetical protein
MQLSRPHRTLRLLALLGLGALAACNDGTGTDEREFRYGIITMDAESDGAGGYITSPVAVFYRFGALGLPSSIATRDSCQIQTISSNTGEVQRPKFLSAGDNIGLAFGASTFSLMPDTTEEDDVPFYGVADQTPPAFTPGATASFSIPGASPGFPAMTITAKTAEAFTLGGIADNPAAGQDLPITWTPAGDEDSKVVLNLKYASQGSAALNQQIVCNFKDDGAAVVPSRYLAGWRASHNGNRQAQASRWRTSFKNDGDAYLLVLSTFDVTGTVTHNP